MVKQQLANIYFSLKPQVSFFSDTNILYTVYILPSVYVHRYTHRVHTHSWGLTQRRVTFILITGLCSVPDWKREAFQKEMHRLENCTQYSTRGIYTQFKVHTLNLEFCLEFGPLKKTTKKSSRDHWSFVLWRHTMRRCVGGKIRTVTHQSYLTGSQGVGVARFTGRRVRVQHCGSHIVWGAMFSGCSVAGGPNNQPFPFSVPAHHNHTSVTQLYRPWDLFVGLMGIIWWEGDLRAFNWSVKEVHTGENFHVGKWWAGSFWIISTALWAGDSPGQDYWPCPSTGLCMANWYEQRGFQSP